MQPFSVELSDGILEDLWARLERARWPDQVDAARWDYGTELSYLRELVDYWLIGFDCHPRMAKLILRDVQDRRPARRPGEARR